jgi:hypothetical protein
MANKLINREIVKSSPRSVFLITGSIDTAETAVTKIDISALIGAPTRIRILSIEGNTEGLNVQLSFDRATNGDACVIAGSINLDDPIEDIGTGAGTGDLLLSTLDLASGGNRGYTLRICVEEKV